MVKAIEFLAPDVAKVTLRLPLHENLKITAGQFIDLTLANGVRRSYSIANPPKLSNMVDVEFHIRQMPGGAFTDHVFGKMKVRERIECRGPLGKSEERRVGKEGVSTCRSRWSSDHKTKKEIDN